jgi:hypothetical protein
VNRKPDVGFWPIATNFPLGPDVSFWGEAEVDRAAEFAASVENDPSATSATAFCCDAQRCSRCQTVDLSRKGASMRQREFIIALSAWGQSKPLLSIVRKLA